MRKVYNKLVRDKIPEIIENTGKTCNIEILSDDKYIEMLDKKLDEELNEFHEEHSLEELADLMEVIYGFLQAKGITFDELEKIRLNKKAKRGGFEKKILLKYVDED